MSETTIPPEDIARLRERLGREAEEAGLVKIDILGNRSLAVIRDALAAVNEQYGYDLKYETLKPLDDPATIELLARGDTIGVFYVESPAMRQLQQKTRKGDYEHLVIHSSRLPELHPGLDAVTSLVHAARSRGVDTVIIDGRIVVEGGAVVTVDETAELPAIDKAARELYRRADIPVGDRWPRE